MTTCCLTFLNKQMFQLNENFFLRLLGFISCRQVVKGSCLSTIYLAAVCTRTAFSWCRIVKEKLLSFPGLKLFKEPSFKSNKFIIHNALSRCCLAGKVNETQKNKIVEVDGFSLFSAHTYFEKKRYILLFTLAKQRGPNTQPW